MAQSYCLIHRYAAIQDDQNLYHTFKSARAQTLVISLGQIMAISLSIGFYSSILKIEASFIALELIYHNILGN